MQTILVVVHLFLAIGMVAFILLQHGKGADAGAAFGSGASSTVFGAQGSASFLSRATAILAVLFFSTSMALAYFSSQAGHQQGLMDEVAPTAVAPAPPGEVPDAPVELVPPTAPVSDVPSLPAAAGDNPSE